MPLTLLCLATYRKGDEFLRECRRQGCRVLLATDERLAGSDWPREAIDAFYYLRRGMSDEDIRTGAAHLARTERLDRIVALDDFDVETAAMLREAADAVAQDDRDLASYLRLRADDLLTSNYEAGDAAWVSGQFDNVNA